MAASSNRLRTSVSQTGNPGSRPGVATEGKNMKEIARSRRKLKLCEGGEFPTEDVVLCHDPKRDRPWGFARVQPGAEVQNTDVILAQTNEEMLLFDGWCLA